MEIDLRVSELLSSKICHDLISPVSAINNGVELIEDIGETVVTEAMKLIADSASQASRRLRLFRVAYGRAGSEENLPIKDMRLIAEQYFSVSKTKLTWPEAVIPASFAEKCGGLKTLINLMMMAEEILAYGGQLAIETLTEEEVVGCRIRIVGRNAALSQSFKDALEGTTAVDDLTPRTVQSYMTGKFAQQFGFAISSETPQDETLILSIKALASEYDDHHIHQCEEVKTLTDF